MQTLKNAHGAEFIYDSLNPASAATSDSKATRLHEKYKKHNKLVAKSGLNYRHNKNKFKEVKFSPAYE
jgi:hypothetical protein